MSIGCKKELNDSPKYTSGNERPKVIDLFAGAGGMSKGFELAGFDVVLANEYDETIANTYQQNHPNTKVIVGDIRDITVEDICKEIGEQEITLVTGGPPCQGFSMSGNRIRTTAEFIEDPRNYLFKEFYKVVEFFKPKYFVMENVEGLLTMAKGEIFKTIYNSFDELGYHIAYDVLDARYFGVPQARKRLIIIGSLESEIGMPPHSYDGLDKKFNTIYDAISDLNYLNSGEGTESNNYLFKPKTAYQIERRKNSESLINHVATRHSKLAVERMSLVRPGENRDSLPVEHQTKSVHSGAYGRMEWGKTATTITTRFDTPSVGRVIHPELNRTLTVREAARIQSFDDDYHFFGSKSSQGIQVGNAVPPLLAKSIAEHILMDYKETYKYEEKHIKQV